MKRFLLAGATLLALTTAQPTFAADAPVYKGPAPAAAAVFNWSGCYIGANLGGVWGRTRYDPSAGPAGDIDMTSVIGGGHLGCNWQAPGSALVLGVEGDWSWMNLGGEFITGGAFSERYRTEWNWMASARGRIGWAMGMALWYATGGVAWANLNDALFLHTGAPNSTSVSGTHLGWTVGAGVEYAFTPNWIIGAEYLYAAFEQKTYTCVACGPVGLDLKTHTVRARASWKW